MRFNYKFKNKKGLEAYKYEHGKIYKITSPHTDKIYIGSTIQPLNRRMNLHRSKYKLHPRETTRSNILFKLGDTKIELIENYPCSSVYELERREGYYQKLNNCVNGRIAKRTKKEYYRDNKKEINKQQAQKIMCECGSNVRRSDIARHKKSNKHINFFN